MKYYHCTKCGKKYKGQNTKTKKIKTRGLFKRIIIKNIPCCCDRKLRVVDKTVYEAIKNA